MNTFRGLKLIIKLELRQFGIGVKTDKWNRIEWRYRLTYIQTNDFNKVSMVIQ